MRYNEHCLMHLEAGDVCSHVLTTVLPAEFLRSQQTSAPQPKPRGRQTQRSLIIHLSNIHSRHCASSLHTKTPIRPICSDSRSNDCRERLPDSTQLYDRPPHHTDTMVADALIYHPAVTHFNKFVATTGEHYVIPRPQLNTL